MMIDVWKGRRWGRWNKERLELGSSFFSMYAMRTGCTDMGGFDQGSCQICGSKGFRSGFYEGLGRV